MQAIRSDAGTVQVAREIERDMICASLLCA